MRYFTGILMAALAGCGLVVHSTPVTLPDGTQGYTIHCNGAIRDISDCMNEAAKICAGPYHVVGADQATTGGAVTSTGSTAVYVHGIRRSMIVSCGAH